MAHRALKIFICIVLMVASTTGWGQANRSTQIPESSRKLIAINVTGSKRFAAKDVIAASGLQVGTIAGDEEFKKAARQLGETGAFSDVAYSFSYTSAGTTLNWQVADAPKFVPAHFEDFVWFTDSELRQIVKDHVPLFNGELPLTGRMAAEVSDVLQAQLVEKAVPGHVEYVRYSRGDGPVEAINYSASDVLIRIRKIEFTGAATAELLLLEAASQKMSERAYSRTTLAAFANRDLLPLYHSRGYLKAAFGTPEPRVVSSATSDASDEVRNTTMVDVTWPVTPGEQYKLSRIEWSGNHEIPTEKLQSMIHATVGQPADTVRLQNDLEQVQKLYGSLGYITETTEINAQFDNSASTVAIMVLVNEGSVFHMGDLEFRGLDNGLIAKLRAAWKLRSTDVYDANYLIQYLQDARKLLPASLDWEVAPHVTANVRDKTVDVDLQFTVKAPR